MDVMHLSPGQSFVKMAFGGGKSISSEEFTRDPGFAESTALSMSPSSSDKSSVLSLEAADTRSYTELELKAVEQLEATRRLLKSEINVSY